MIQKWIANNPLTIKERIKIKEAIDKGMSYGEMAIYVGRAKSTVMREAKRLGPDVWNYDPKIAQKDFETKQKLIGKKHQPSKYSVRKSARRTTMSL